MSEEKGDEATSKVKSSPAPGTRQSNDAGHKEPYGRDSTLRLLRIIVVPLFLLAAVPLLVVEMQLSHRQGNLLDSAIPDVLYFGHAAFGLIQGHIPYKPGFMDAPYQHRTYLYPPLTLLLSVPAVIAGSELHYPIAFAIEAAVLVLVGMAILRKVCQRIGITAPVGLVVLTLLFAMGPLLLTRLDAIQGLLIAGSGLALMRGKNVYAVMLVTFAILIKETAVLALVPVVFWCLFSPSGAYLQWSTVRRGLRQVGLGIAPGAALFLIFLVWAGGGEVASSLASVQRGLEIETIPASIAILLQHFIPVHVQFGQLGSYQIRSRDAGILAVLCSVIGGVIILGSSVWFARRHNRPLTAIAFCVTVGLCATPVLSPQFIFELLPVLGLASLTEFPLRQARGLILLGLVAALLTQVEYPYLYASVDKLEPLGMVLIVGRNAILMLIAGYLVWRYQPRPVEAEAPGTYVLNP